MAAEIRLHGLQGPEKPNRGRYAHDGKPPRLMLVVGKSPTLREVPLTRDQLLGLAAKAIEIVQRMDREEGR